MVTRKNVAGKAKEKPVIEDTSRKVSKKIKIEMLQDAIQEGKWLVPVGGEVIIERFRAGSKPKPSICVVRNVEGDNITTWDATIEQWFSFNVTEIVNVGYIVKILK